MTTRRRLMQLGATAVAVAVGLPRPAIAQGIKELKMATSWTTELQPGWGESADRLAQSITAMSDSRLTAAKDPLTSKVYDNYMVFLAGAMDWELSETGYRDTRRLALG